MKYSVVLTLLATFFSTGHATSNNDASESLTSQAKTARGIPNPCKFFCILDGGSNVEVENCIKTRCGGVNVEDGFEENAEVLNSASEVLISEAETAPGSGNSCHFHCVLNGVVNGRSYDEVQDCIKARCGGVNVEDGFEKNAEVLNSEAETTQEPPSRDHICEFVCRHYLITEEDIQDCIRVDCGRFNATNDGKKNSSEVLISEAETAPGSGNSCHFQCVLNGRSYDEVQECIKARCRGVKTENDGKKNFDATEVLISEPENEPEVKTENNDVSEVLITETFLPLDPCTYHCIANGQTHREIENCINWRCNAGKSDKSGEANAIASEVRISENASTAQASPECIWDCLRALGVHAVSEDDFEQCSLECGSRETIDESEKEFNLRGSIKSD